MNKHTTFLLIVLFIVSGCSKRTEVIRLNSKPHVLNDDILTVMPGDLVLTGNYLVWSDPFSKDYFLHVHDAVSGDKIGDCGKIGEGPEEFVTPSISRFSNDNCIFACDANGTTVGYLSIDSLVEGKNTFIPLSDFEKELDMSKLDSDLHISNTEDGNTDYFELYQNGKRSTFGKYPINKVKQHVGGYKAYDKNSNLLVFASFKFPYLALYQKNKDTFKLLWERIPDEANYDIRDNQLIFNRKIMGAGDLCMCKDYIVTLERDREVDPLDESTVGRDPSKCPRTVFLYDYDGNLLKIIDLGMPTMRITANRESNKLYAIGVNPDYVLVKYEL